ncbi:hypothetical protein MTR67_041425 [Solanum verrucosum]|uniref:Amine oxidase domain-containing protein n=1 Tax=Solanum verrucosum TaxID=315347 RepID=A0AAF0UKS1_SOLVR|nr:hypothetical protein MTR67_041425 [Solanum verrucosum]
MEVAVVGAGISGLVAAYELAKSGVKVVIYEKENYLRGHAKTVTVDGVDLDVGFIVFNRVTYPNLMEFFELLGVDVEISDMSFSVSLDQGRGCEWGTRNGFSSLFAQKKNVFNLYFWQMMREISKFKQDVTSYLETLENNPDIDHNETLGHFIQSHGYSELFQKAYLKILNLNTSLYHFVVLVIKSASVFSLQISGRPQWLTVRWRSHAYVNKVVKEELQKRGCHIRMGCEVNSVTTNEEGCTVACTDGSKEVYNGCIMAAHAPDTLRMLGKEATYDETRILGAFQYVYSDIFLHCDKTLLPRNPAAWSSWNFLRTMNDRNLGETERPYCVTLNPPHTPEHMLLKWTTSHPVPSVAASRASSELYQIQGKRGIWFCGAYQGYGFHEDGLKAGTIAAQGLLKKNFSILKNPKHMVATQGDLGLADAFIHGDFSFVDKNDGLLNLFMIFVNNRDLKASVTRSSKKRGWWTPLLFTAAVSSAKYFIRCVSNQRTLTQARRNISRHYDLSNELFSLFLDKTMTYSCAIFTSHEEDLKVAQERKISLLIEKAKVKKEHHILEIGCGWGSLTVEVVKQMGCKYTGINLSEQQLKINFLHYSFHERWLSLVHFNTRRECRAPRRHRNPLLSNAEMLAEKLPRKTKTIFNNILTNQIHALGFDDKFIRTWKYYFDYCAAGFKTRTLGDYQIVFSMPGNVATFDDPYNVTVPSAY